MKKAKVNRKFLKFGQQQQSPKVFANYHCRHSKILLQTKNPQKRKNAETKKPTNVRRRKGSNLVT